MKKSRNILTPKFTRKQIASINEMVDVIAGSPSEVVSRIVTMWLKDNHQYVKEITKGDNN